MTDLITTGDNGRLPSLHPSVPAGDWGGPESADTIDLRTIVAVLRRHLLLIGMIAVTTFAAGAYVILNQPDLYRARAVIRLLDERQAITGGIGGGADQVLGKANDPLLSQLQVLQSFSVAEAVIERTGLRLLYLAEDSTIGLLSDVTIANDADSGPLWLRFSADSYSLIDEAGRETRSRYGVPVSRDGLQLTVEERPSEMTEIAFEVLPVEEAVDRMLTGVTATPRDQTDVVDVEFVAPDPHLAQRVVNAIVEEFAAANARTAQQQSTRRRLFIEEQLDQAEVALADAELALSDFRERQRVYRSEVQFSEQQSGLLALKARREELESDRRMYQSLLDELAMSASDDEVRGIHTLVSAPGIATNPVIAQLFQQLVQYESVRDSLTAGTWSRAESDPDVQRIRGLVADTRDKIVDAVGSHLRVLAARIVALDELEASSAAELEALPAMEAEERRLTQHVATVRGMADQLRTEYQRARIAEAVEAGQVEVVDLARLPSTPIRTGKGLTLALVLVFGLMLGSGAAFLREHFDTIVRRLGDVENDLRIPGLAVIPNLSTNTVPRWRITMLNIAARDVRNSRNGAINLITMEDQRSTAAEAFRGLRTSVLFSSGVRSLKTLVITSAGPGDGKTTVSANLAASFAQQGIRTLLIDADLRRPVLHRAFQRKQTPGLSDLLAGNVDMNMIFHKSGLQELDIFFAGTVPPNPAELLGGGRMDELLTSLEERYDLILIDTPPLMAATDAAVLSTRTDGTLLVVRAGYTSRLDAQSAGERLANVGAHVLGVIINDPDSKLEQRYGRYAYYGYGTA